MQLRSLLLCSLFALAACGGSTSTGSNPAAPANPPLKTNGLVPTSFTFTLPKNGSTTGRGPKYLTSSVASVVITLDTVNGAAPPTGLIASVTSSFTPTCSTTCTATVQGPAIPPGSDRLTLTTYDAGGHAISTANPLFTITPGVANSLSVVLDGIPASFTITALPSGTAGTAFGTAKGFALAVKDADGNTITGTYANPVTIADSDSSSLTQGTALAVNGGAGALSVVSTASTDTLALNYGGLAIPTATLTASATGATNATATFTPTLQPIAYSGPLNGSTPEIDLYASSGYGSTFSFNASEVGWTNAPYGKSLAVNASTCSTFATATAGVDVPATGTPIAVAAIASPVAGTCTMTVSDPLGQTKSVVGTYTSTGIGIQ